MKEEIIIAGFGGQGVLSMGKILAYSGIMQDQETPVLGLSRSLHFTRFWKSTKDKAVHKILRS